ncbi:acid protease [Xylariomycetidae sp. FL0641]|nr:acid protease [Xylariomycetidae sp. FL0641]
MHSSLLLLSSLALAVCGSTLHHGWRDNRYVKMPVVHSTNRKVFADMWDKRMIETVELANRSDVAYYAKLNIGTPVQQVYVQLDTGSFELWVNPDCDNLEGASDVRFCQAVGKYDPSSSSTSTVLEDTTLLRYGIGSASIQYVKDKVGLSGTDALLDDVQFGVARETRDEFSGILGIGHGQGITMEYPNFVDQLAAQDVTDTKAFSLALGSKSEEEGVIIFGGMDTGKFAGTLQTLPIIPADESPDGVQRYWIHMDSMSLSPPNGETTQYSNSSMDVFLDSGATLTLLPEALANSIASDFGAGPTQLGGYYLVNCSLNDVPGTLNFDFNGISIKVPYREIVRELRTAFGVECFLGISPNDDFALLGDTMLRAAYAVFDQTNNAIHMAQYVNCDTREVEITAQTNFTATRGKCTMPVFDATTTSTGDGPSMTVVAAGGGARGKSGTAADAGTGAAAGLSVSSGWLGPWTVAGTCAAWLALSA